MSLSACSARGLGVLAISVPAILRFLYELYRRDRPVAVMASDRDAQTVEFIEPEFLDCAGHAIRQNDRLADKLALPLLKLCGDLGRSYFRWHRTDLVNIERLRRALGDAEPGGPTKRRAAHDRA